MASSIAITPCGPVDGTIRPPGSKSITNRALMCAALADGKSRLEGALESEDTHVMVDSLRRLGLKVGVHPEEAAIELVGCGGMIPHQQADLYVGNSGTTIRFLTAALTVGTGEFRLDGVERMRKRPIGDLIDPLRDLGAEVRCDNGCPPVEIAACGLRGGGAMVRGDISSQFLSGLLMAAPYAKKPVELTIDGPLVSQPYVSMTLQVMEAFGVTVDSRKSHCYRIAAPRQYQGRCYTIEPDASAASYFWAAAGITGGRVTVEGLTRDSLQGDVAFCDALEKMGCRVDHRETGITVSGPQLHGGELHGIEINMNAISDTVQTLAAAALFAKGPTTITGVAHIRHKETDRIGDLARELRKFGAQVEELPDGLRIHGRSEKNGQRNQLHGAQINTYNDHRMAMSLSLVGLQIPGVTINDPGCTRKTYPQFFADLDKVRQTGLA